MRIPYYDWADDGELSYFGDVDLGGAWEFDKFLVIRHNESGDLYYGTDSGCSCPCPFEGHTLDDFTKITGPQFLYGALNSWAGNRGRLYASDVDAIAKLQLKVADYFSERRKKVAA